MCDRHTAYDAFVRDFDIIVPEDGVGAFTEDDHVSGLEYMKCVYGAKIKKASDIVRNS
jgi:isochorismate hydrolase